MANAPIIIAGISAGVAGLSLSWTCFTYILNSSREAKNAARSVVVGVDAQSNTVLIFNATDAPVTNLSVTVQLTACSLDRDWIKPDSELRVDAPMGTTANVNVVDISFVGPRGQLWTKSGNDRPSAPREARFTQLWRAVTGS